MFNDRAVFRNEAPRLTKNAIYKAFVVCSTEFTHDLPILNHSRPAI